MKRIVVTGSSGFVGQHVLNRLMQEQCPSFEVYALYREQNGLFPKAVAAAAGVSQAKVHFESLDLTDETAVQEWVASHPDVDLCLHLAAMSSPSVCEREPQKALECNNPQHWFRALFSQNIPIVALSTDQVYDGTKAPYKETDEVVANSVNVRLRNNKSRHGKLLSKKLLHHSTVHYFAQQHRPGAAGTFWGSTLHLFAFHRNSQRARDGLLHGRMSNSCFRPRRGGCSCVLLSTWHH